MARAPRDPQIAGMQKRLDEYPDSFRPCRERRHWWDEKGMYRHRESGQIFIVFVYECSSCGAEKQSWFNRNGDFEKSLIHYPSGYLFKLTDKEREVGFRFTARKVMEYRVRKAKGLEQLEDR